MLSKYVFVKDLRGDRIFLLKNVDTGEEKVGKRFTKPTHGSLTKEFEITQLFFEDVELFREQRTMILPYFGTLDLLNFIMHPEFAKFCKVGHYSTIFYLLLREVFCCHGKGVIHGDIKPSNFMVIPNKHFKTGVKLIDFGCSCLKTKKPKSGAFGTRSGGYMAPELIKGKDFSEKIDIWSLGVTMFTILTRSFMFNSSRYILYSGTQYEHYINLKLDCIKVPQFRSLIHHCVQKNPSKRPSAGELLSLWQTYPNLYSLKKCDV